MRTPSALWFRIKLHLPLILRVALILGLVLAVFFVGMYALRGCSFLSETVSSGGALLEGASAQDSYQPFGSRLLRFDGTDLSCHDRNGEVSWTYTVSDAGADYRLSASSSRAALFAGSRLILLDDRGNAVYSGLMDGQISRVRCGDTTTAVELEGSSSLIVLDKNGGELDLIDLSASTLVDFGFYSNNELLWTLSINISGLSPSSRLDIYKPGKELVSSYMSGTQFYYKPLFYQSDVYILGTEALDLASASSVSYSVYGWQYADSAILDDGLTIALTLSDEGSSPAMARVFRKGAFTDMHLPAGCFDLRCGEKGLYGVSNQTLHLMPYDGSPMTTYAFRYTVADVVCVFSGHMAVSTAEGDVYLVKLP